MLPSRIKTIASYHSFILPLYILKSQPNYVNSKILQSAVRTMAGHSKWQNIKKIKTLKDTQKSVIFAKHAYAISRACLEGGSTNVKLNSKLAAAIELARTLNMPNSTIDTVLKRIENKKFKEHTMELGGPGGCYLIVELQTDNVGNSIHDIKSLCRKNGGTVLEEGRTKMVFERKGIVRVSAKRDNVIVNSEKALEDAILSGAEDVKEITGDEDDPQLEFVTSANDIHKVRSKIEKERYGIVDAGIEYVAVQKVSLSEDDMNMAADFCNKLRCHQDVQRIFDNIE